MKTAERKIFRCAIYTRKSTEHNLDLEKVCTSLLEMAQKWHEFADFGSDQDVWTKTFYHRAIQTKIGQDLRAQYDLPKELPHRILTLLAQLNAQHDEESGAIVGNGQSGAS